MLLSEKLLSIRQAEGLTRKQLSEITGVPVPTMKRYETGRIAKIGSDTLIKYTQHPRFQKYTLWLMSDITAPDAGQIAPAMNCKNKSG